MDLKLHRLSWRWCLILSLLGYGLIGVWFRLWPFYDHAPLFDVRSFSPSLALGGLYALLIAALFGLSLLLVRRLFDDGPRSLRVVLFISAVFAIPLLFTYPINANDIYRYVLRGRIQAVHGGNPFMQPPVAFPTDPVLPLAGEWATATSPYGPLWELLASLIVRLTGGALLPGLLGMKLLGLAALLISAVILYHLLADQPERRRVATAALWAWNPALLLMFVVDGHNDAVMLMWLLLGGLLLRRSRPSWAVVAVVVGALVKPVGLLVLPLFVLAGWRTLPTLAARGRFLAVSGLATVAISAVAFAPFGSPIPLALRLLSEASAGAGFSPIALLILMARRYDVGVLPTGWSTIGLVLFGLFVLWSWWRLWGSSRPREALFSWAGHTFLAYVLQAFNFRIWYAVWPFGWWLAAAALGRSAFWLRAGWWFLLMSQLSVVVYGHLNAYLFDNMLLAHLFGVALTFGVPLALARWGWQWEIEG